MIVAKVTKDITLKEYEISAKSIENTITKIDARIKVLEEANTQVDQQKVRKQLKNIFFGIDNFEDLNRETLFRLMSVLS